MVFRFPCNNEKWHKYSGQPVRRTREMLARCEEDATLKAKMDRVKALKEELASL
jgi:hypothetical protein